MSGHFCILKYEAYHHTHIKPWLMRIYIFHPLKAIYFDASLTRCCQYSSNLNGLMNWHRYKECMSWVMGGVHCCWFWPPINQWMYVPVREEGEGARGGSTTRAVSKAYLYLYQDFHVAQTRRIFTCKCTAGCAEKSLTWVTFLYSGLKIANFAQTFNWQFLPQNGQFSGYNP